MLVVSLVTTRLLLVHDQFGIFVFLLLCKQAKVATVTPDE